MNRFNNEEYYINRENYITSLQRKNEELEQLVENLEKKRYLDMQKYIIKIDGQYYAGESEKDLDLPCGVVGNGTWSDKQKLFGIKLADEFYHAQRISGTFNVYSELQNISYKLKEFNKIEVVKEIMEAQKIAEEE